MKRRIFLLTAVVVVFMLNACGSPDSKLSPEQRVDEINWVISKFEHNYAPLEYKQKLHNFSWEQKKAEFRERAAADISNDKLRVLIQEFVGLFADAHTSPQNMLEMRPGVMEVAYLGFAGFRFNDNGNDVLYVQNLLPTFESSSTSFPLKVGDKISKVDGQGVYEFVKARCPRNLGQDESNKTAFIPDLAILSSGSCTLPESPNVVLTLLRDGEEVVISLPWIRRDYFAFVEEQQRAAKDAAESDEEDNADSEDNGSRESDEGIFAERLKPWNLDRYFKYLSNRLILTNNVVDDFSVKYISSKMLFAPITATTDDDCTDDQCDDEKDFIKIPNQSFKTMVVNHPKALVGYIKIESFMPETDKQAEHFKKALDTLEALGVRALVIDLADNGGGSLEYGLELAGFLKASNSSEPALEVRLNDNWLNAAQSAALFSENDSVKELWSRRYQQLKKDSVNGRWLSERFHISEFNLAPRPANQDATNVVLMVNEMCASMCDIFTADLKDNGIATIIGKKTMGAGGNVTQHAFSPRLNYLLSQTESLIVRANGEYLENKGVEVDVPYEPTLADLKGKNVEFIKAAADLAIATTEPK